MFAVLLTAGVPFSWNPVLRWPPWSVSSLGFFAGIFLRENNPIFRYDLFQIAVSSHGKSSRAKATKRKSLKRDNHFQSISSQCSCRDISLKILLLKEKHKRTPLLSAFKRGISHSLFRANINEWFRDAGTSWQVHFSRLLSLNEISGGERFAFFRWVGRLLFALTSPSSSAGPLLCKQHHQDFSFFLLLADFCTRRMLVTNTCDGLFSTEQIENVAEKGKLFFLLPLDSVSSLRKSAWIRHFWKVLLFSEISGFALFDSLRKVGNVKEKCFSFVYNIDLFFILVNQHIKNILVDLHHLILSCDCGSNNILSQFYPIQITIYLHYAHFRQNRTA